MDTEAVGRAALLELAEENHFPAHFLDGDVEILHAGIYAFQIVEFVIMGGEEGHCPLSVLVDVLHYCTGDGHPVVGGCSPADFIQEDQRTFREIVQDHRSLEHLDHEGGLSAGDIVRGSDPGEKLVEESEPDLVGRHERANLGHQYNEGCLAEKG